MLNPNLDRAPKTGIQKRRRRSDETDPTGKTADEAETIETTVEAAGSLIDETVEVVTGATTDDMVMIEEAADEMTGEAVRGEVPALTEGATEVQVHTEGGRKKQNGGKV